MDTNLKISRVDAFEAKTNASQRFEQLRLKLIRETERYLNNPNAESWARLGALPLARKSHCCSQLTAA
jgi:hypothetical protein